VAFGTGGTPGDDTLTSSNHVNDNQWHHVVVTRNQETGEKRIFIDGVEDAASPGAGTTALLNDPLSLSVGTRVDARYANPQASPTTDNSYDGLMDDLQIYARPLTADEVTFLYTHPGLEVTASTQGPIPIDVQVRFEFHRNAGQYWMFPVITSVNPPAYSEVRVVSPNGALVGSLQGSSSPIYTSLDQLIQECNGTNWLVEINETNPNPHDLRFSLNVFGLDESKLPPVPIYAPADGSVNVATNPVFWWSGPVNFQGLNVVAATPVSQNFSAFLNPAKTNWTSPPLSYGTNQFFVNYTNTFPTVTISSPVDILTGQSLSNWVAGAGVYASGGSAFVVGAPTPLPVYLGAFQHDSSGFQFSFATLAGRPHILQGTTNLSAGPWVNLTNFVGDGSAAQFTIPPTNRLNYFRILTQ